MTPRPLKVNRLYWELNTRGAWIGHDLFAVTPAGTEYQLLTRKLSFDQMRTIFTAIKETNEINARHWTLVPKGRPIGWDRDVQWKLAPKETP